MLTYVYTAREIQTGNQIKAEVEADNEASAAKLLTDRGLAPLEITLKQSKVSSRFFKRIPTKERIIFSRQLSTLIDAGLPLVQSLNAVRSQTSNKEFQLIIGKVINDVEAGSNFSEALSKYPKIFNQVYVSLVAAGETSGTLDRSLQRLATQQEKDAEVLSKVRGAFIYPILVLVVIIAVVTFMLVKVLPQVELLYEGLPGGTSNLPFFTKLLLALAHFIIHFWWLILLLFAVIGVFFSRWAETESGGMVVDGIKMHAWPFGPLFMKLYMARFTRTGATLVGSGVSLLETMEITAKAVNNRLIAKSIRSAEEKVRGGKSLSESISGDPNFLALVPNMIHIGEQSGSLESMMSKTADYYEKELDNEIKNISTVIEPVLMIIMGIFAMIVVAAILLPIYSLVGKTGFKV